MEEFSIAKLEEELGLYGYLHNATSMCNRTAGMFAGSTDGWKNGKRRRSINKYIHQSFIRLLSNKFMRINFYVASIRFEK